MDMGPPDGPRFSFVFSGTSKKKKSGCKESFYTRIPVLAPTLGSLHHLGPAGYFNQRGYDSKVLEDSGVYRKKVR